MLQSITTTLENPNHLVAAVCQDLHGAVAGLMKIDPVDIRLDENLGSFGFDSISLTEFATLLNQRYAVQILPSVFYTCTDIQSLAEYFVTEYEEAMADYFFGSLPDPGFEPVPDAGDEPAPVKTIAKIGFGKDSAQSDVMSEEDWFGIDPAFLKVGAYSSQVSVGEEKSEVPVAGKADQPFPTPDKNEGVAVIGMSGIFPGSPDLTSFWQNLEGEADLISEVPASRWDWRDFYGDPASMKNKMLCKWGGFIDGVDLFDAEHFNISPREAALMDPQHRLFLLTVWRALENAGYDPGKLLERSVGVFGGVQFNDYQTLLAEQNEWNERVTTGCSPAMLVNRVSFLLNLRGPCEAINTACSSSLVAVHRAFNAVCSGEVEMAIAGGVGLLLSPYNMLSAGVLNILSPEGRCKTFDASADGYVKGEGVGVVVLKPLAQALAHRDHIHAVIRGTAVNHGGRATSLTAPNPVAQAQVVKSAVRKAGIDVETIGYIETHGTGTKLGDPVEIEGLKTAFGELAGDSTADRYAGTFKSYCGLGSVKANIGHLEPAAGIAGLLKVILALEHRTLPGNPHFKRLNPYIKLNDSPFYVVERTRPWPRPVNGHGQPRSRRAGVSSFGFGGTNAHVVLEEAPVVESGMSKTDEGPCLFVLSAGDKDGLKARAQALLSYFEQRMAPFMQQVVDDEALDKAVLRKLAGLVAKALGMEQADIMGGESFRALGLDMLLLSSVCDGVNKLYQCELDAEVLLQLETLEGLHDYLFDCPKCDLAAAHPDCVRSVPVNSEAPTLPMVDIAYTLQVGREAMAERLAFIATGPAEVVARLTDFIEGCGSSQLIHGCLIRKNALSLLPQGDEDVTELINAWVRKGKLNHLAGLWVKGVEIDWRKLYGEGKPRRVALPAYAFDLRRYWYLETVPVAVPSDGEADNATSRAAPGSQSSREEIEKIITRIWKNNLGVQAIDRDDDFFDLGGDSIISTRIINQLELELGFKLPVGRFLDASTIAAVSGIVVSEMAAGAQQESVVAPPVVEAPVSIRASSRTPSADPSAVPIIARRNDPDSGPLSSGQERFWFLNSMFPDNPAYNIPAALLLKGDLEVPRLEEAFRQVIARHEALRLSFKAVDGAPVQRVHPPFDGTVEFINLSNESAKSRSDRLRNWLQEPFDLSRCPLLRLGVARFAAREHVVKLVMHHIISDVWSMGIVLRELLTIYGTLENSNGSNMPDQRIHFGDYAAWQQRNLEQVVARELPYWVNHLAGAPEQLLLPLDRSRPEIQTFAAGHVDFNVPEKIVHQLKAFSRQKKVSLYVSVLSAFNALLSRISGLEDIMVGTPVANRSLAETEGMVGFLANTLVLRNDLSGDPKFDELVERVRATTFNAYDHQQVPFSKVVEAVKPKRATNYNPLFQVMFNMFPPMVPNGQGELDFSPYDVTPDKSDYDLVLRVDERDSILAGAIDYNRDLFSEKTMQAICEAWLGTLHQVSLEPGIKLSSLPLPPSLAQRARQVGPLAKKLSLVITATFIAEPIQKTLDFWIKHFDMAMQLEFAPYNQVFQQLLDSSQRLLQNQSGVNLVLVRLADWVRFKEGVSSAGQFESLAKTVEDFIEAVRSAAASSSAPLVVMLCPSDAAANEVSEYTRLEERISEALKPISGVYLRNHGDILSIYEIPEIFDPRADQQGHMPFTSDYYCALATLFARTIFTLRNKPYKVIAVDCDNTLWRGVVGEDGVNGIEIDPGRRRFQQFLVNQQKAGVLICLCSKNEEQDVLNVLDQRPDMLLRREHVVSHRINWQPKSTNLAALADELNLGSDSFIFIDDNPVECGEMRANLPEVLTFQLPQEEARIDAFLRHTWVFDRLEITAEDTRRTRMYRQNISREREKRSVASFADFLAGLELHIELKALEPALLPRVSQLTYRTNQFNFTTRRRSESEIQQFCDIRDNECLTVSVRDRFGDYGLVGVVLFSCKNDELLSETFLLSCRVLGKGVEHAMVARLGELASERSLARVVLPYLPSPRNTPALDFLNSLTVARQEPYQEDGIRFVMNADEAASLRFIASDSDPKVRAKSSRSANVDAMGIGHRLGEIPMKFNTVTDIRRAVRSASNTAGSTPAGQGGAPRNQLERTIADAVCEKLGINNLGLEDNFFDIGAHSSALVQVAGKLEKQLGRELPVIRLFQHPTIRDLAGFLLSGNDSKESIRGSRRRGQKQRRILLQLRQAGSARTG